MTKQFITLVGAGAFAREVINWNEDAVKASGAPAITGFLDTNPGSLDGFSYRLQYRGSTEAYAPAEGELLLVAIGDPAAKQRVVASLRERGARFASLVHPSSVIAGSARLGEGVVVCPLALVSADATVGEFVAINAMSSIGHDVVLGAYSTLSAHVDLTGRVQVGECCFFGTGAKVLPGVRIGARAKIGAGSLIMRQVQPETVMYAAPAKKL
ncbi:MAG: acetyltransferase [Burkholderiales bacterium]|jgi:sugar O-acyltransferase (sialic acid O-acetyltransferase NeuD family)|nr:acetyltransferase [Burkholderiales bacterium]